jgi:hypothetical protein
MVRNLLCLDHQELATLLDQRAELIQRLEPQLRRLNGTAE